MPGHFLLSLVQFILFLQKKVINAGYRNANNSTVGKIFGCSHTLALHMFQTRMTEMLSENVFTYLV